jgi:6-phosphogluconolactonase
LVSTAPEVEVSASADELAAATAARVLATLGAALGARPHAHLVVTGGGILEQVLGALGSSPDRDSIDWSRVHVWWGDERYVGADSADRNDLPALRLLFDLVPATLHRMPAADAGFGEDVEAAAAAYAAELAAASDGGATVPRFDTVLLGIGPDGHCASLFPHHPGTQVRDLAVIGVRESPKPPPNRISLTFPTLDAAAEVWFIASGTAKADAVAAAVGGADPFDVPSAGPRGLDRTLWLIDREAAAGLA